MPQESSNYLALWDYGWCEHCTIKLPGQSTPNDIPNAYLLSHEFGTSFVFPEPGNNPNLHGPFLRSSIEAKHFKPFPIADLSQRLRSICLESPDTKPVDLEQWQELELLARSVIDRNNIAFELSLTTADSEAHHEWGWVLLEFREFIFSNPGSSCIERLVIGYD